MPAAGGRQLRSGAIERWLAGNGMGDLGRVAREATRATADDTEAAQLFIEFARIHEYFRRLPGRRLSILLMGRTGVGKSSMVNTLGGSQVAAIGDAVPVTSTVHAYDTELMGIPCRIVDTPGLCDGTGLNDAYTQWILDEIGASGVDCVCFVTPLSETRVRTDEIAALELVTKAFGPYIWHRSVVALTFADYLHTVDRFQTRLQVRPREIRTVIDDVAGRPVAGMIPFVAVTNDSATTSDGRHWLGPLLLAMLQRMSPEGVDLLHGDGHVHGGKRYTCFSNDADGIPPYRFICRSVGEAGHCSFCLASFAMS